MSDDEAPRKIVKAHYNFHSAFVIPDGIDLEGDKIEDWWVKWDTLYIKMHDGTMYEVKPVYSATDGDFKHPDKISIEVETIYEEYEESEHVTKS